MYFDPVVLDRWWAQELASERERIANDLRALGFRVGEHDAGR